MINATDIKSRVAYYLQTEMLIGNYWYGYEINVLISIMSSCDNDT